MSKDVRSPVKTNRNPLNRTIADQLEIFIVTALTKLKNLWRQETSLTGIQFYGDLDD
jgi:hypothetical protein